jgi:hypothetical protein
MKNKLFVTLIAAIAFLNSFSSYGQNKRMTIEEKKEMHKETSDDPYRPNRFNNKKTSPAYKYRNSAASRQIASGTTIYTTQVNVDAGGQNILFDAANETNIAMNPLNKNEIVIGWREFDDVSSAFRQAGWSYTSDGGLTWTFPGVIEPGIFRSDPVLDYDADGNFYYNSLTNDPDFFCKIFKSTNGGATWNSGTDAHGGDKQCMVIDRTPGTGNGNIYSSWTSAYSTCLPGFFTRSTDGNVSYENCTTVEGDPYWGTMAIGNSGELYIGAGSDAFDSLLCVKSLNAQIPASLITWDSVLVYMDGNINAGLPVNPAGLLGQVSIDVDHSTGAGNGNIYLVASLTRTSNADPGDVMFAKSSDGGATWSSPIRINDDLSVTNTQWFGTMSVAPTGRIDVIWLDTREDLTGTDLSALYYSYSYDQGNTWSANEKLSAAFDPHLGYPNQDKMGDYFDMISDSTGAHLAWANTLNGEEDAYYSYIVPPAPVGVTEISPGAFSVFPNPTKGIFFITSQAKQSRVEINSTLGQKLFSTTIFKTKNVLDISSQPAGIYFLKIVGEDGRTVVKKIIKE